MEAIVEAFLVGILVAFVAFVNAIVYNHGKEAACPCSDDTIPEHAAWTDQYNFSFFDEASLRHVL